VNSHRKRGTIKSTNHVQFSE
jgi:hypothetical protein